MNDEIIYNCKKYEVGISVSLEGATRETDEAIRGKGHFSKAIETLKRLKDEGVITGMLMTVSKFNYHEVPKFIELGEKLNIDYLRINFLRPIGRAKENKLTVAPLYRFFQMFVETVKDERDLQEMTSQSFPGFLVGAMRLRPKNRSCGTGLSAPVLDSDGSVYPCFGLFIPEFKLGNIREEPLHKILFQNALSKKLRKISIDNLNPKCSKCWARYLCTGGCRGLTYGLTGDINAPDPRCDDFKKIFVETASLLAENPGLFETSAKVLARFVSPTIVHSCV